MFKNTKTLSDYETCSVCGCLIPKCLAIKGEPYIYKAMSWKHRPTAPDLEDRIVTPYYCKVHAPKKEEPEKKK